MAISAAQVKELRQRTGCGMMECKNALVEALTQRPDEGTDWTRLEAVSELGQELEARKEKIAEMEKALGDDRAELAAEDLRR